MPRQLVRSLVLLPPALLLLSGLALLASLPGAWGAAGAADLPDWMPPAGGLIFAALAVLTGGLTCLNIWRRFADEIFVVPLQLGFATLMFLLSSVLTAALALRIGDASAYDGLVDAQGQPNTSPAGFAFVSLGACFFLALVLAGCAYVYVQSVTDAGPERFAKRPEEADAVGEILRGRRGPARRGPGA